MGKARLVRIDATSQSTRFAASESTTARITSFVNSLQIRAHLDVIGLAIAAFVVLSAMFFGTFSDLTHRWNTDANYSHGFLVPLVSLYLAFQGPSAQSLWSPFAKLAGGVLVGTLMILLGVALRLATILVPSMVAECAALLTILAGLSLLVGGWPLLRRLWAPIGFLIFMVPWPSLIYGKVAFPLQLFVSHVAAVVLQVFGIPTFCDGNLIHLPGQTMHVAEACSGLRQLTAFLAICSCAALLMNRPAWYRGIVLASSIPIAVAINVLRVTGTGLMLQHGDPAWTEGTLHTLEGLLMVALGLALLTLQIRLLDWLLEGETVKT